MLDAGKSKKPPAPVRPSASIILLSPTNQILLLHRVQNSSSFASAHVFPGGNLSEFHDAPLPKADSLDELHRDGLAYRLAAIRETFEESGILLARGKDGALLQLEDEVRDAGRKEVHGNKVRFGEWVTSVGGEPDVDNLIPFTRWITPAGPPKRFTTQMYLYMLPLSSSISSSSPDQTTETIIPTPTHDGGLEHTAATFAPVSTWLSRARKNDIILFPPQFFLLNLISPFLTSPSPRSTPSPDFYASQRTALLEFLQKIPTSKEDPSPLKTHLIPWSEKVISPTVMFVRQSDKRYVLGLDKPGPELRGSGRGGDWERVVLVDFRKEGPRDVEVRGRNEVLREEKEVKEKEEAKL